MKNICASFDHIYLKNQRKKIKQIVPHKFSWLQDSKNRLFIPVWSSRKPNRMGDIKKES